MWCWLGPISITKFFTLDLCYIAMHLIYVCFQFCICGHISAKYWWIWLQYRSFWSSDQDLGLKTAVLVLGPRPGPRFELKTLDKLIRSLFCHGSLHETIVTTTICSHMESMKVQVWFLTPGASFCSLNETIVVWWTDLYDGPEQEHGGDRGRRPPLEVDCDEGRDEADDGGVARRERLARVSLVLRRALHAAIGYLVDYKYWTQLDSDCV